METLQVGCAIKRSNATNKFTSLEAFSKRASSDTTAIFGFA